MSRSYRKPVVTQGYGSKSRKVEKRHANNKVKTKDLANGSAYKKASCSWDICDYKMHIDPPTPGGTTYWGVHYVSEEDMAKEYRKARRK